MSATVLVTPSLARLPGFRDAHERGWSPDNVRGQAAIAETLAQLDTDAEAYVRRCADNRAGGGPPVTLPDGSQVPRLPGLHRWIWDADDDGPSGFCGLISLRWNHGFAPLPPHVLGHVGYAVVPWQRGRGHARRALGAMLAVAREIGLPFIELTTDTDNAASQRVISGNGGELVERFTKDPVYGGAPGLRWRIGLQGAGAAPA